MYRYLEPIRERLGKHPDPKLLRTVDLDGALNEARKVVPCLNRVMVSLC